MRRSALKICLLILICDIFSCEPKTVLEERTNRIDGYTTILSYEFGLASTSIANVRQIDVSYYSQGIGTQVLSFGALATPDLRRSISGSAGVSLHGVPKIIKLDWLANGVKHNETLDLSLLFREVRLDDFGGEIWFVYSGDRWLTAAIPFSADRSFGVPPTPEKLIDCRAVDQEVVRGDRLKGT